MFVGGAALVLSLTGCGGSSKPSVTATSAKPSATTTVPDPAADRATATSLSLVQADLPAGWVGTPHPSDPSDAKFSQEIASCAGASEPSKQTADVHGPDFDKGNAEVSSEVSFVPTRAAFEQDAAALKSSKYQTCIKTLFETELQAQVTKDSPGVKVGAVTLTRFATPTYGELTVGLRLSTTITGPTGESLRIFVDSVEYGQGRSEVSLTFSDQGAQFDPALEQSLVAKAAAKLRTTAA